MDLDSDFSNESQKLLYYRMAASGVLLFLIGLIKK